MSQTPSRLAGVLIASGWAGDWHAFGDVGRADGGEGGRVGRVGAGGDAVCLAGDGLGEQLDGEAGVAGGVAANSASPERRLPASPSRRAT